MLPSYMAIKVFFWGGWGVIRLMKHENSELLKTVFSKVLLTYENHFCKLMDENVCIADTALALRIHVLRNVSSTSWFEISQWYFLVY